MSRSQRPSQSRVCAARRALHCTVRTVQRSSTFHSARTCFGHMPFGHMPHAHVRAASRALHGAGAAAPSFRDRRSRSSLVSRYSRKDDGRAVREPAEQACTAEQCSTSPEVPQLRPTSALDLSVSILGSLLAYRILFGLTALLRRRTRSLPLALAFGAQGQGPGACLPLEYSGCLKWIHTPTPTNRISTEGSRSSVGLLTVNQEDLDPHTLSILKP